MRSLTVWLAIGYLWLIPIGWSPFPWNIQWSEVWFVVLAASLLGTLALRAYTFHSLDLLVGLYLLGSFLSLVGTSDLAQTSLQLVKHLYLVLVYVVFSVVVRKGDRYQLITAFGWSAGLLAWGGLLAVLAHYWAGTELFWFGATMPLPSLGEIFRLRATFHTPEFFGDYLAFTLPLLLGLATTSEGAEAKRVWWLAAAAVVAANLFTFSHSLVGLLVAIVVFVWPAWAQGSWRVLRMTLVLFCVVVFIGINVLSIIVIRDVRLEFDKNEAIGSPSYVHAFHDATAGADRLTVAVSYNPMIYYLLKRVAWEAFWRAPVTGVGLGTFHDETERAYREGKVHERFWRMDPHSSLLGRLAETGIVGAATMLLLLAGFLVTGSRLLKSDHRQIWIARAVLAGLVGLCINSVNVDIMNFRFLWVGFALLRGIEEQDA